MAESRDPAVSAERAALAETRRRITATLDAIDAQVRPPAAQVARGIAAARHARGALTLVTAGVATARQASGLARRVRSLSRLQVALIAGGVAGAAGVLGWLSHERGRTGR
jgi:hypothetical protein